MKWRKKKLTTKNINSENIIQNEATHIKIMIRHYYDIILGLFN